MNIVLDGVIFEQQAGGGIQRTYQEIMPRICNLDSTMQFTVLTYGPTRSGWPAHSQINHRRLLPINRYIQPGNYFHSLKHRIRAWTARFSLPDHINEIWHSTHYTLPYKWQGPVLISAYDLLIERFASMFNQPPYHQMRADLRRCISVADGVICNSETTKQEIIDFYQADSSKLYVVPLAHSNVFRSIPSHETHVDLNGQKPFFLYVGGRSRYKNFETVLTAYEAWPQKDNIDLLVVGAEWSPTEKERLSRENLHNHVRLVTHADDELLCVLYNNAQAFIYSSLYEGFGLPPLEAMACGCPVIASRIPSTIEVAGDVPVYFEPTEPESLRDALDTALSETQNATRLNAGFARLENYSWDKTAQQTLDLYRQFSP